MKTKLIAKITLIFLLSFSIFGVNSSIEALAEGLASIGGWFTSKIDNLSPGIFVLGSLEGINLSYDSANQFLYSNSSRGFLGVRLNYTLSYDDFTDNSIGAYIKITPTELDESLVSEINLSYEKDGEEKELVMDNVSYYYPEELKKGESVAIAYDLYFPSDKLAELASEASIDEYIQSLFDANNDCMLNLEKTYSTNNMVSLIWDMQIDEDFTISNDNLTNVERPVYAYCYDNFVPFVYTLEESVVDVISEESINSEDLVQDESDTEELIQDESDTEELIQDESVDSEELIQDESVDSEDLVQTQSNKIQDEAPEESAHEIRNDTPDEMPEKTIQEASNDVPDKQSEKLIQE